MLGRSTRAQPFSVVCSTIRYHSKVLDRGDFAVKNSGSLLFSFLAAAKGPRLGIMPHLPVSDSDS